MLQDTGSVAAVDKDERTQRGTIVGAIGGHGSLQKERLDLGFFREPRGGEAHFSTEIVYKSDYCRVNKILGKKWMPGSGGEKAQKAFFRG